MKKGGAAVAGPIWNKFMNEALKILPGEQFEEPNLETDPSAVKPALRGFWQGNENFFIDKISGKLASPNTPKETRQEKVITNMHSILYWLNKKDILGAPPANPEKDPQFNHFEKPIQNWWALNKGKYPITAWSEKPSLVDDVHIDSLRPKLSIIEPNTEKIYSSDQKINLKISSSGPYPLLKMDIFINDSYLGTSEAPFVFFFTPSELNNWQAENEIKIIAYDSVYNSGETTSTFKIQE